MTAPGQAGSATQFGLRCSRCGRSQPALPRGIYTCVYCSALLPVPRWQAVVPPGVSVAKPAPPRPRPYGGPPSYRGQPPRWGFPPVIWRPAEVVSAADHATEPRGPVRGLRVTVTMFALLAVLSLAGSVGEFWRFRLLLRGRTEVLPSGPVVVSDALVAAAGWTALWVSVFSVLVVLPVLVRVHTAAAVRAGLKPSRRPAAVLARLVIPGWNLYGAGQVLAEIDGLLRLHPAEPAGVGDGADAGDPPDSADPAGVPNRRPRLSGLVLAWWCSWILDSGLVVLALLRAFGRSEQAMADTVELHIGVDLAGGVVAVLTVALLRRFRRRLESVEQDPLDGWVVALPVPTTDRGRPPAPTRQTGTQPDLSGAPA